MSYAKVIENMNLVIETLGMTEGLTEKRVKPRSVRLEERLYQIALSRLPRTGANDFSDYVRGLIIADALSVAASMAGIDIPGWLVGKRVNFTLVEPEKQPQEKADSGAPKGGRKAG